MAYKDSGEISNNSNYALGDYSFRIERSSVPGSSNDKIEAICTDKDGKNARKSIQVPSSTQLNGWYVEANETEATVYAQLEAGSSKWDQIQTASEIKYIGNTYTGDTWTYYGTGGTVFAVMAPEVHDNTAYGIMASTGSDWYEIIEDKSGRILARGQLSFTYEEEGKTVYYAHTSLDDECVLSPQMFPRSISNSIPEVAWHIVYDSFAQSGVVLVGRFAIDVEDAGGVGPGSDWIDPGDYDPDWEEGDPTHTLYITVTGALSGRHNDPIEDPSYSYIPADKDTIKDYGCGGDGGHGGGGGAGASTVVVHKFATNQANSKEVTAIARRHGYGSGGGKGGKGGDGCILVYY